MRSRLVAWAGILGLLAAAGCDGSSANPKVQGDPPANQIKPLPLHNPPGGSAPNQPASPAIKPAG